MTAYADQQKRWRAIGYRPPVGPDRCTACHWHTPTQGHNQRMPERGKTMSENRFSASLTPLQVMIRYGNIYSGDYTFDERTAIATDALARIAELSPRTVDAAGRERAVPVVMAAMREAQERGTDIPSANRWLDRIIDALGWTAEPEPHRCADVADDCCERTPAPVTPAVELTASELESLAGIVWTHERAPLDVGPLRFSLRSVPMVVEDMPERDGAKLDGISVLRIGGDQ